MYMTISVNFTVKIIGVIEKESQNRSLLRNNN